MIVVCLRCHLINSCIRDKAPPTQLLIEPQTSVTILLMYVPIKKSYVCSHKKMHKEIPIGNIFRTISVQRMVMTMRMGFVRSQL